MKFLLSLSFCLAAAVAHDFTTCPGKTDGMGVTSVTLNPDPAEIGKSLDVVVTGTTTAAITDGTGAHLTVLLLGIPITSEDWYFCKDLGITCPLAAGEAWTATFTKVVPANAPSGLTVTINLAFDDAAKNDLGCITLDAMVVAPPASKFSYAITSEKDETKFSAETNQFLFTQWAKVYDKHYEVEEVFAKFGTFSDNVQRVVQHNAGQAGWKMGLNQFSDMTKDEFGAGKQSHGLKGAMGALKNEDF